MRISQIKISTWRVSRAILIVASLSSAVLTGHGFAMESGTTSVQEIVNQIKTNLGQQIAQDSSLNFTPVELATYAKNDAESEKIVLQHASTHNLGHLQELLKGKMRDRLDKLNALQAAARNFESGELIMLIAREAYGAFNYVYGVVDAGTISKNAKMCADNTWLVKAFTDYGIISQAYRLIAESRTNKHDEIIAREDSRLKQELESNMKAREDERAAKSLELDSKKEQKTKTKIKVEKLLSEENDNVRISAHESTIVQLNKDLDDIERQRKELNETIDAEIGALNIAYEQQISELKQKKSADLGRLQSQLNNIFEDFGRSWGGKTLTRGWHWNRSMREEFKDLDTILSVEYTDLHSKAKSQILEELFSLVEDESPELAKQKSLTLKTLLDLNEENYQSILDRLIIREEQRNIELAEQVNLRSNELAVTIENDEEEKAPDEEEKAPTTNESNVAHEIASKFEVKKKVEIPAEESKDEGQSSEVVVDNQDDRLEESNPVLIPDKGDKSNLNNYPLFDREKVNLPAQIPNQQVESSKLLNQTSEKRKQKKNHRRKNRKGGNRWR